MHCRYFVHSEPLVTIQWFKVWVKRVYYVLYD